MGTCVHLPWVSTFYLRTKCLVWKNWILVNVYLLKFYSSFNHLFTAIPNTSMVKDSREYHTEFITRYNYGIVLIPTAVRVCSMIPTLSTKPLLFLDTVTAKKYNKFSKQLFFCCLVTENTTAFNPFQQNQYCLYTINIGTCLARTYIQSLKKNKKTFVIHFCDFWRGISSLERVVIAEYIPKH